MSRPASFHRGGRGGELLQAVMVLAVAGVILAVVRLGWSDVTAWFEASTATVVGWTR